MPLLLPPDLCVNPQGPPRSGRYDDIYHPHDGALTQAQSVFLTGNGLPTRWQGRSSFVIFETGFGLGLNFLATALAFQNDAHAPQRLHFISVEAHPVSPELLYAQQQALTAAVPELAPLVTALYESRLLAVPGVHRRHFLDGRLSLTVFFGEAQQLHRLSFQADAFYLDGFSPAKNPQMWSEPVLTALANKAAPGTTLATWCVSGAVRRTLTQAGFRLEKAQGFGRKRERLQGVFEGRPSCAPFSSSPPSEARTPPCALVIGAGLAGTSLAQRLAVRGWRVCVLEARARPAEGASGNHAGVLRPLPSLDDNFTSRLTRSASLYARAHLQTLSAQSLGLVWNACGVLHLGRDARHAQKMAHTVLTHGLPENYIRFVSADEASTIAGVAVAEGGWWFPEGAVVGPRTLCEAQLASHPDRITVRCEAAVAQVVHEPVCAGENPRWVAKDAQGRVLGWGDHVVLACGTGLKALAQTAFLPLVPARGQVSVCAQNTLTPEENRTFGRLQTAVCRQAYVTPFIDGAMAFGATFSVEPDQPKAYALRPEDHEDNRQKWEGIFPGLHAPRPARLDGRVGFRPATPDRLPIVGPLAVEEAGVCEAAHSRTAPAWVLSGFGARGLVFAPLLAETLASWMNAEPLPMENDLLHALRPGRFRPL